MAELSDESCRNWLRVWRDGETFLDTHARQYVRGSNEPDRRFFRIRETRPLNERYALVWVDHEHNEIRGYRIGRRPIWDQGRTDPIYMVYDVQDNSCRETTYAAGAWLNWPKVPPELELE